MHTHTYCDIMLVFIIDLHHENIFYKIFLYDFSEFSNNSVKLKDMIEIQWFYWFFRIGMHVNTFSSIYNKNFNKHNKIFKN